jgi:hypothetical protein
MAGTVLISLHSEHSIAAVRPVYFKTGHSTVIRNMAAGHTSRCTTFCGGTEIQLGLTCQIPNNCVNTFSSVNMDVMLFLFGPYVRTYGSGRRPECLAKTFHNYEYCLVGYDAMIDT